jgi:hypothetical protein
MLRYHGGLNSKRLCNASCTSCTSCISCTYLLSCTPYIAMHLTKIQYRPDHRPVSIDATRASFHARNRRRFPLAYQTLNQQNSPNGFQLDINHLSKCRYNIQHLGTRCRSPNLYTVVIINDRMRIKQRVQLPSPLGIEQILFWTLDEYVIAHRTATSKSNFNQVNINLVNINQCSA